MSEQSIIDRLRDVGLSAESGGDEQTDPYAIGRALSGFRD